jgi:hypothetical protein
VGLYSASLVELWNSDKLSVTFLLLFETVSDNEDFPTFAPGTQLVRPVMRRALFCNDLAPELSWIFVMMARQVNGGSSAIS